ncbi:hypothetical protein TNCV_4144141 [Trichonephila clavipes]|nr:hypothetical protein TNCV_4144141 [Trichonephila clavipes]
MGFTNSRIQSSKSCTKLVEREGTGCRNSSLSPPSPFPMRPALGNTALNTNEYSLKKIKTLGLHRKPNLPPPKVAAPGRSLACPPLAPAQLQDSDGFVPASNAGIVGFESHDTVYAPWDVTCGVDIICPY